MNKQFWIPAIIIVLADQITKSIINSTFTIGQKLSLTSWLGITHYTNSGAGFGILQNQNILLIFVTLIVLIVLLHYYREYEKHKLLAVGAGLVFGGGVGNLIDRIVLGHVTDFIAVGWWPIFNIADSAITIGVILLLLYFWKYEQ